MKWHEIKSASSQGSESEGATQSSLLPAPRGPEQGWRWAEARRTEPPWKSLLEKHQLSFPSAYAYRIALA